MEDDKQLSTEVVPVFTGQIVRNIADIKVTIKIDEESVRLLRKLLPPQNVVDADEPSEPRRTT